MARLTGRPPLVTVGMPVYNGAATVGAALESLLTQSFADFHIIISDNASTDDTEAVCREFQQRDARIRYVRQPVNIGAAMNFRFVLFQAGSPFFMWAAADDLWAPSFIARNLDALRSNPRAVCSQAKVLFTVNGVPSQLAKGTGALPHDPLRNVARFLTDPADNSRYYGLYRTEVLRSVFPARSFYGLDWAVSAATLRFGTHVELPDILMIRDASDAAGYERSVAREHRFWLWRVFPVLFMSRWLVTGRRIPLRPATLASLARLNLRLHLRFALYRLGRLSSRGLIQAAIRPGLRERLAIWRQRMAGAAFAGFHRVWRAVPLRLHQREAMKRGLFRLLGRRAAAIAAFDGWVPVASDAPAPLPTGGWAFPVAAGSKNVPAVTVIMVACDAAIATLAALDSLARTCGDAVPEVMLIDRGSCDITSLFGKICPSAVYVRVRRDLSYGAAANAGVQAARGDSLIFLDQHARVRPDFVSRILEGLRKAAMAGPLVLSADHRLPTHPDRAYAREADACPGAFAVRRASLAAIGGIAAACTTVEAAGTDLARRLHRAGRRVVYWPAAAVALGMARRTQEPDRWRSCPRRLLYVDTDTPAPDRNAGSFEAINLMRLFGDFGFLVTFAPEGNLAHRGRYTDALQALGIHAVYQPYVTSIRQLLEHIGAKLDLVVLCRGDIAGRTLALVRAFAPRARIVFNAVDLHGLRLMREAELAGDRRLTRTAQAAWTAELAAVARSEATIVVSGYEQELLRRELPEANVHVVPLVRDIPERLDVPGFAERRDLLFIGTYQHPPNRDAVRYFASAIWPTIRSCLPDARFLVVGSSLTDDIRALAGNGIEVLGFVEDLDALLARCRLTVAPLRFGAGLKGKVATSLQAGVPMVASGIAVEGTTLVHATDILVADDPEAFAAAVVRLYTDAALWQRLAAAGFANIRREYSIEANVPRIAALLRSIGRTDGAQPGDARYTPNREVADGG